jgi:predicted transcriptional regulator
MKDKKIIVDKTVYGGMLVEKYFLILEDGTDIQVPYREWELYQKGDEYPKRLPDSFVEAMKDIEEGKTVPLDKALNEDPWKEAHDLQQKLVVSYTLENEKLKDKVKLLELKLRVEELVNGLLKGKIREYEKPSEKVDKICKQLEKDYKELDYYRLHNHVLETANDELAEVNKMMKDTLINIWECFEMSGDLYHNDWAGFQALGNKARICLENVGYEWRNDKKDNKS